MLEGWMWEMASFPILEVAVTPFSSVAVTTTSLMVNELRESGYTHEADVSFCWAPARKPPKKTPRTMRLSFFI